MSALEALFAAAEPAICAHVACMERYARELESLGGETDSQGRRDHSIEAEYGRDG